jgi:peptide chain release factor subunit 1
MLHRDELKEFTGMRDDDASFVSLYLNVDPISNPKGDYIIRFKNMIRDTAESLEKTGYKLVKDDLIKMESYVTGNKRMFKKGLVLLSSGRKGFWREYHLAVPVSDEIVVEKSPYIRPLLDALDHYRRYVIALVDKESARIFIVHLGEIVEYGEVHTSDVPGRHKKGGWFALSQNHYDRHIKFHVGLHLNDVVKKLDSFMAGEEISGLLIGGSDEALVMTKGMLAPAVSPKIVGSFQAEMNASSDDILAKAEAEIGEYEKRKKYEMVERLVSQAMKNENAVLGLENVLNALHEGKVMRLVFLRDYKSRGYYCEKCGSLGFQNTGMCAYCRGELTETNFIIDMAAQKAVGQGASVEVVQESSRLADSGGIGAFLRF